MLKLYWPPSLRNKVMALIFIWFLLSWKQNFVYSGDGRIQKHLPAAVWETGDSRAVGGYARVDGDYSINSSWLRWLSSQIHTGTTSNITNYQTTVYIRKCFTTQPLISRYILPVENTTYVSIKCHDMKKKIQEIL